MSLLQIYICICNCIHIYDKCMYLYTYIICKHVNIYMHIHATVSMHTHLYTWIYTCIMHSIYACIYTLLSVCIHTHIHIYMWIYTCKHVYMHITASVYRFRHIYMWIHTHIHVHYCQYVYRHRYRHTHMSGLEARSTSYLWQKHQPQQSLVSVLWVPVPTGWWRELAEACTCHGSASRRRCP